MIIFAEDRGAWWAPRVWRCFLCARAPTAPAVYWRGAERDLVLCAACAASLGTHLVADAREAELASGRRPWITRVTRAAVAAIERHAAVAR